jgi:hypothetical protein
MAAEHEKTTTAEAATDTSKPSTLNNGELSDGSVKEPGKAPVDEYPHGLRLFLLAGASIMGVFLISLDQVST